MAVSPDSSRLIAQGISQGHHIDGWLPVWDCIALDDCTSEFVHLETGARIDSPVPSPWTMGSMIIAGGDGFAETTESYLIVDDAVVLAPDITPASQVAADATGTLAFAAAAGGQIAVVDLDGREWTLQGPAEMSRFVESVAFVTLTSGDN